MENMRSRLVGRLCGGSSRGQISLESMLIVGFLLVLLIPIVAYVLGALSGDAWQLDAQQANVAATRIASIASRLAMGGPGTFSTETVFLPSSIMEVSVNGNEITFVVDAKSFGLIDEVAVSDVPLILNPDSNWTRVRGMNVIMMNVTDGGVMLTK